MDERLRHHHAPLHAAGEAAHVRARLGAKREPLEELVDPAVVRAQSEIARLDLERLAHGEERIEDDLLRHDADGAPRGAVIAAHVVAHHRKAARVGAHQPAERGNEGGLAGAVRPEEAEEFALGHGERHARERDDVAVTLVDAIELRERDEVRGQVGEVQRLAAPQCLAPPFEEQRDRRRIDAAHAGKVDDEALGQVGTRFVFGALREHVRDRGKGELAGDREGLGAGAGAHFFVGGLGGSGARLRSCSALMSPSMPPRCTWSLKVPR